MDSSLDKILLTALLTFLAGFITFVLSIVKLVNEKESKTTDYRQSWTDSVRTCLATLIARINSQAGTQASISTRAHQLDHREDLAEGDAREFSIKQQAMSVELLRDLKKETFEAYALASLHFKPGDANFTAIQHRFETSMRLIDSLQEEEDEVRRAATKEKIHSEANEIANSCRIILKTEWEIVKKGEPTYALTKRYSIYGGVISLTVLILLGIYALGIRGNGYSTSVTPPQMTNMQFRNAANEDPNNLMRNSPVTQTVNVECQSPVFQGTSRTIRPPNVARELCIPK